MLAKLKVDKFVKQMMLTTLMTLSAVSTSALAQSAVDSTNAATTDISVAIVPNANVFSNFTDELPAVVNYFTNMTEQEIINFYQEQYGEVLTQERKRERLVSTFSFNDHKIRIVISTQGKVQQVDMLLSK